MTYNIHKGIGGVDRRYDLQRIIDVIRHYQPDIAFLQEVDDGVQRSQNDRQVELLADALGFPHLSFQNNVAVQDGHYGNAILSRYPLGDQLDLDLKVSIKKTRRALITRAEVPIGTEIQPMLLCNTHLGLSGFERSVQIKRILTLDDLNELSLPFIVGGDFNDVWEEHGRKLMFPLGFQSAVGNAKTFPAALPVRSLDAIYYRGDLRLLDSFSGRNKLTRHASDHLPVIADFMLVGASGSRSNDSLLKLPSPFEQSIDDDE
ncbi:MAG: endonuclease/exonuclease/phosphatase family protein [Planctomycetales bacterium]|nr:endonuclease/exonuclease/phosphatase family protein [Planctomycetales bacterium]